MVGGRPADHHELAGSGQPPLMEAPPPTPSARQRTMGPSGGMVEVAEKIARIRSHEADQVIEAPHLLHIGQPHLPNVLDLPPCET
jgi:hypothetical protein